jgi:hypothetical protein
VAGALPAFLAILVALCRGLPAEELASLDRVVERKLWEIDRADIHAVTGGSDDGFLYSHGFAVAMGREFYDAMTGEPEMGVPFAECEEMCYFFAHLSREQSRRFPGSGSGISRESGLEPDRMDLIHEQLTQRLAARARNMLRPRAAPLGAINYRQMRGLCLTSAACAAGRARALLQCRVRPVPVSDGMVRMRSGKMFSPQGGRPDRIKREGMARDGTWTRAHARRRRAGNKLGSFRCRPARQVQQDRSCHGRRACPAVRRGGQRAGRAGSLRGTPAQTGGIGGQPGSLSLHPADLQARMQPGLGPGTPGQPEAKLAALAADAAPLPGTPARTSPSQDRPALP